MTPALEVVEDTDAQGTVIGVLRVVDLPSERRGLLDRIYSIPLPLWLAGWTAIIIALTYVCLSMSGGAMMLEESGSFTGTGHHELSASGPLCSLTIQPANESILEAGNNSTVWHVFQNGTLLQVI
jgi:hypothetical protein